MVIAPSYDLATQAKMVPAFFALHNFIRVHDINDLPLETDHGRRGNREETNRAQGEVLEGDISTTERSRANRKRDAIAMDMWEDYRRTLEEVGENLIR